MRSKATFLAGFATGYVLGSRAGRARYEQIRSATRSFMANPTVQSTASRTKPQVRSGGVGGTRTRDRGIMSPLL